MRRCSHISYENWIHILSESADISGALSKELDKLPDEMSKDAIIEAIINSPRLNEAITKQVFDSIIDLIRIKIMESPKSQFYIPHLGTFCVKMHKGHKVKLFASDDNGPVKDIPDYKVLRFVPDNTFKADILMRDQPLVSNDKFDDPN